MPTYNLTESARIAGVGRSTIIRAIRSGRLSATTNEAGERVVDSQELLRCFGQLKGIARVDDHPANRVDIPPDDPLIDQLRDQLADTKEQLRIAQEQVRQTAEERSRLLTLLEAEQSSRRLLEQKLLPAPQVTPVQPPPPPSPAVDSAADPGCAADRISRFASRVGRVMAVGYFLDASHHPWSGFFSGGHYAATSL